MGNIVFRTLGNKYIPAQTASNYLSMIYSLTQYSICTVETAFHVNNEIVRSMYLDMLSSSFPLAELWLDGCAYWGSLSATRKWGCLCNPPSGLQMNEKYNHLSFMYLCTEYKDSRSSENRKCFLSQKDPD